MTRLVVSGPLVALFLVAGLLRFFGKPSPRRLAYALAVGLPVVVAVVTALLAALFPTTSISG